MKLFLASLLLVVAAPVVAQDASTAFRIKDKVFPISEVQKSDEAAFYEIDSKKYELIEQKARDAYLQSFFDKLAKDGKTTVDAARSAYFAKQVSVKDADIKGMLEQFKDHPQLKDLPPKERETQIRQYLTQRGEGEALEKLISGALASGDLQIMYPRPVEPVYKVALHGKEPVRYGPGANDTAPVGCAGDACAITIVEFSEFQCPFCSRSQPAAKQAMTEYKGKIRWITKDFPLSFHDRARPAAVAAHCAGDQGKFWNMYTVLFDNQQALSDADLVKHAETAKVDMAKWKACIANPAPKEALIDENMQAGMKTGVTGTPAFFINGRRLSGALPFAEFKRVIDEELTKPKRSE